VQASSRGLALERGVRNVGPMAVEGHHGAGGAGVRAEEAVIRLPAAGTTDDLERADRVVALKTGRTSALAAGALPGLAEKVEFWHT